MCLTRDGALACLHDAYLPLATTLTGWAHERRAADVLAGRLLDREGRATAERPLLVDELLDLVPPALTVQVDVKAHADAALARRTVDALAAVLARRPTDRRRPPRDEATTRPRAGPRAEPTLSPKGFGALPVAVRLRIVANPLQRIETADADLLAVAAKLLYPAAESLGNLALTAHLQRFPAHLSCAGASTPPTARSSSDNPIRTAVFGGMTAPCPTPAYS